MTIFFLRTTARLFTGGSLSTGAQAIGMFFLSGDRQTVLQQSVVFFRVFAGGLLVACWAFFDGLPVVVFLSIFFNNFN